MALPETIRFQVNKLVGSYCEQKVPLHLRDKIVVIYEVRGNAVTIFETRPPWREGIGHEWTKSKIAQMRWDSESKLWTMWWADRNGRWLHYPDFDPSPDIKDCLRHLEDDVSGAFWG